MNKIRLHLLQNLGPPQFRQIQRQTNMIVQRKRKSLRMTNTIPKFFIGQILLWSLRIHCQNLKIIPCLGHVSEHFIKSIGIS